MEQAVFEKIDSLLANEDYTGALAELATIDNSDSCECIARRIQLLRAAGRPTQATKLVNKHFSTLQSSRDSLLRVLPVILQNGYSERAQGQIEEILASNRSHSLCRSLYELKGMTDDDPRYLRRLLDHAKACALDEISQALEDELADELPLPRLASTEGTIAALLKLFKGRPEVHARQLLINNRWGYMPIRSPLEASAVSEHIEGNVTLGVYPLRHDFTVWFAAIDVDIKKNNLAGFESDLFRSGLMDDVREATKLITKRLEDIGLEVHLEFSGYKGFHVWTFFEEPIEAKLVRNILKIALSEIEIPQSTSYEIFPKQDKLKRGQIGNLIKVPNGVNKRSGRISCWVAKKTLEPIEDQANYLESIEPLRRGTILHLADLMSPSSKQKGQEYTDEKGQAVNVECVGPIPNEVVVVGPTPNSVKRILNGCPVLDGIVKRASETHVLSHPEAHVLCYVFGVLGEEGRTHVHRILHHCLDYDPSKVNKRLDAVPPNPMSCPKVRKWLPDQARTAGCRCHFQLPEKSYPSPLCHAGIFPKSGSKVSKKKPKEHKAIDAAPKKNEIEGKEDLDALMAEFFRLLNEVKNTQNLISATKQRLDKYFSGEDGIAQGSSGKKYKRRTTERGVRFETLRKKRKKRK